LAKALRACPGIRLLGVTQMSNHVHLVLRDDACQLSNFMCRFEGALAKFLNKIDGTSGQVIQRRFAAIEAIDRTAIVNCIAYAVVNPVKAGLVPRHEEWPGLLVWPGADSVRSFSRVNPRVSGENKVESYELALTTELLSPDEHKELRVEVERRTAELQRERDGKAFMGVDKVLAQSVFDSPEKSKCSPKPLCHSSCLEDWKAYAEDWKAFVEAYRMASRAFRDGNWAVRFPEFSFRPWSPIRLVPSAVT